MYVQKTGGVAVIDPELIPLVAARFKLLGEPGRLAILATLQEGEKTVGDLAEATGRGQPNVSQHLAALSRSGLVDSRRQGQHVIYRIADPYVARICEAVCASLADRARKEEPLRKALGRARTGGRARA
ncbi:MAG TPA: metalloregulator ArsR/SmtB family transcription factor [Vicinamibacteria bacterium]|nr:metalloregulator ArsR/SmtB family transcription factor [Vicinamibacteria bacterium]